MFELQRDAIGRKSNFQTKRANIQIGERIFKFKKGHYNDLWFLSDH